MNITISLNEQTSAKLLEALAKVLTCSTTSPKETEENQILKKTNEALQEKLTQLEQKLAQLEAQSIQSAKEPIVLIAEQPKPEAQQTQPEQKQEQEPSDPEKAEKWVKDNLTEWLDTKVPFGKAGGRTWRQLAQNQGDKIPVKGKDAAPRAYLHALETWPECNLWARLKAKAALEYGKNGNGTHNNN